MDDNQKFDCWFTEGVLDHTGFRYIKDDRYRCIRTRHNVSKGEAQAWYNGMERFHMELDAERRGLHPSYCWTIAEKD